MSMDLVDGTLRGEDRRLIDAARSWAGSAQRSEAIGFYQGLMGCSEYRAAELADVARGAEVREQLELQRQQAERAEAAETAAWLARRRNIEDNRRAGVADDTPAVERLGLLAPTQPGPDGKYLDQDIVRDPGAPYGSASNPAFFVSTAGGGLVDIGDRGRGGSAQRSLSEALDDSLARRYREHQADTFMAVERARYAARRKEAQRAAERAELAAAAAPALRRESGTGWPGGREISR